MDVLLDDVADKGVVHVVVDVPREEAQLDDRLEGVAQGLEDLEQPGGEEVLLLDAVDVADVDELVRQLGFCAAASQCLVGRVVGIYRHDPPEGGLAVQHDGAPEEFFFQQLADGGAGELLLVGENVFPDAADFVQVEVDLNVELVEYPALDGPELGLVDG